MTSRSSFPPSDPAIALPTASLRPQIRDWMHQCRQLTLPLFDGMEHSTFCQQAHPDFSPVGWHLGHIGFTEARWILAHLAGQKNAFPQYDRLFAADGLPKQERRHLPDLPEILAYLDTIRTGVLDYLDTAPADQQEPIWRFLLQHESQHCETVAIILALQGHPAEKTALPDAAASHALTFDSVLIPAGSFSQGNDGIEALDNERPAHPVFLDDYRIDRCPVTCAQYRQFIAAGGYQTAAWWTTAGWQWVQSHQITEPLYWKKDPAWDNHPVCGVSWYEADAYTRFAGKRLPTEAEWEKAARWDPSTGVSHPFPWGTDFPTASHCNHAHQIGWTTAVDAYPMGISATGCYDLLGNVWEWTDSWFEGYGGFIPFPYRGYSQTYFDGQHRILRGGSWATRPWALRSPFRNWYHPWVREVFAGFRCVATENREPGG